MSLQIFNDARRIVALLLALRQLTEIVNLFLRGRAAETCRVDPKVSLQVQPFNEVSLPGGDQDLYSEVHRPGHSRTIRLREEAQPVLDPALRFRRAQRNGLTFRARFPCHFAL